MTLPIVHHPAYVAPTPSGHRFPMSKFARLIEVLAADGLAHAASLHEPEPASFATIARAHDAAYVQGVFAQTLAPDVVRRIGFPMSDGLVRRSRAAVGGTILTGRLALAHGLACNTAGGSHHAFASHGAGYCVFNDVAVATRTLQHEGRIARVLVVDLDVHQGDGTAQIFADDPDVFTFSMHCEANYPPRKQTSSLDVGLPRGTGNERYLDTLAAHLRDAVERARPDLVFYNAGVDPHVEDRLGFLALTDEGLVARDTVVLDSCRRAGLPLACVIGGGYGNDIDRLARRHALLHRTAARFA